MFVYDITKKIRRYFVILQMTVVSEHLHFYQKIRENLRRKPKFWKTVFKLMKKIYKTYGKFMENILLTLVFEGCIFGIHFLCIW
jgi:hypothetical protein